VVGAGYLSRPAARSPACSGGWPASRTCSPTPTSSRCGGSRSSGSCLILGLFTRLASLGGIGFLLLFYLANPPFVGYFYALPSEGSYLIVNKNLVELARSSSSS
jgi:hypothetical protein